MAKVTFFLEDHPDHPGKMAFRSEPTFQRMLMTRELGVMKLSPAEETAFFLAAVLKLRSELLAKGHTMDTGKLMALMTDTSPSERV